MIKKILCDLCNFSRSIFIAIITPFYFSYERGHFLSSVKSKAVNKDGQPVPWYTYPAIDFLTCKDFTNCSVLEFGAGQSTLWWAKRAKLVISFEDNLKWYNYVKRRALSNISIYHVSYDLTEIEPFVSDQLFDLIIVDGLDRLKAAKNAISYLKPNGAIIVDDSDGFWFEGASSSIINLYRAGGYSRIDFYGYGPATFLQTCTSIFFKNDSFLVKGKKPPIQKSKNCKNFVRKTGIW